jgi:23S rRNA pseudouridine1911/1915/1917 synthase
MKFTVENRGRVDKLVADALPQYSRAALHKLFATEHITLDGIIVKPGHKVREGATIEVDLSLLEQDQQVVELPILYEDNDVVVINKPIGIISHARGRYWYEPSVASFLRYHTLRGDGKVEGTVIPNATHTPQHLVTKSYPLNMSNSVNDRAGIVHRLDRATSGVMICAKNDETLSFMQKQFSARSVTKTYIAILEGIPAQDEAIIDAPIERNPKKPSMFRVGPNGKLAQTHYKVIKKSANKCLVEFTPKTGRTHQLRVHALYIKCPILGDEFYGTVGNRLYLHAHTLKIMLPNGEVKLFTAPLPREFKDAVK